MIAGLLIIAVNQEANLLLQGIPEFARQVGGSLRELLPDGADFHGGDVNVLPPLLFPEELPGGGMAPDAAEVAARLLQLRSMSNERGNGPVRTGGAGNAREKNSCGGKNSTEKHKAQNEQKNAGPQELNMNRRKAVSCPDA